MWDVFLSYARADREQARRLVEALEQRGYSVWWDLEIVPGQNWLRQIEQAVRQARCVVVLWTARSVASDWVREEASFARGEAKLVPLLLEEADIPLPFRLIQTADLRDWQGEEDHPGIRDLEAGIRARLDNTAVAGVPGAEEKPQAGAKREWKARWQRAAALKWVLAPTLAVIAGAAILMLWRAPATVEIDAVASLAHFRTHGEEQQVLLERTAARSLAIRGFDRVRLAAAEVRIADPASYDLQRGVYPVEAWSRLPQERDFALVPARQSVAATLTIQPVPGSSGSLDLDRIFTGPAEVTIESPEKGSLSLSLRGLKQAGAISLPEKFLVVADFCLQDGALWPYLSQSVTLLIHLPPDSRLLEFSAPESGILFAIGFPQGGAAFLGESGLAVDQVDFLDQGPAGQPRSTLAGAATIRYPEIPAATAVELRPPDFLILDDLRRFRLLQAALGETDRTLRFRFHGVAGKLASGPPGSVRDRRFTRFDAVWGNPKLAALFTILVWLAPTLIALRRFLRENTFARAERTRPGSP